MGKKEYRLPANPKRTIREKQGSHRDSSISRLDYTRKERAIYAAQQERKNIRIKEKIDAWKYRSCDKQECFVAIKKLRHRVPTCQEVKQCSWAIYNGIHALI